MEFSAFQTVQKNILDSGWIGCWARQCTVSSTAPVALLLPCSSPAPALSSSLSLPLLALHLTQYDFALNHFPFPPKMPQPYPHSFPTSVQINHKSSSSPDIPLEVVPLVHLPVRRKTCVSCQNFTLSLSKINFIILPQVSSTF